MPRHRQAKGHPGTAPPKSSIHSFSMPETFWGRLWEKTKKVRLNGFTHIYRSMKRPKARAHPSAPFPPSPQDPLIPIGCTATFMALSMGLYAFKSGQVRYYGCIEFVCVDFGVRATSPQNRSGR